MHRVITMRDRVDDMASKTEVMSYCGWSMRPIFFLARTFWFRADEHARAGDLLIAWSGDVLRIESDTTASRGSSARPAPDTLPPECKHAATIAPADQSP